MTSERSTARSEPLADLTAESGDRDSVTDVNGTIARFEMAYNTARPVRRKFGPPLRTLAPALVFLVLTCSFALFIVLAQLGFASEAAHDYVVLGDRTRPIGSLPLALILVGSGVGTLLGTFLRGIVVDGEGIEARRVNFVGIPRVDRWAWPQVDRIVLGEQSVMLEMWDNTYVHLPRAAAHVELATMLASIATSRNITVTRLERHTR